MAKGKKNSFFAAVLNGVERAGNKLPHPILLFGILTVGIILLSALCAWLGVSASGPMVDPQTLELTEQTVSAVSLLSREGIVYLLTHMVKSFVEFAPLGVVLVTMLGVGCAEGSGFLSAALKKMVSITPKRMITPVIVFLGVMSNIASDVGYVLLVPIGALVFQACGRHPLAGLAAAFAGVSGGFSANLLIGALDPMMAGISTEAASMIQTDYVVHAPANWYFMMASTLLIVLIGTLVTDRMVEPRLGVYRETKTTLLHMENLNQNESLGLRAGLITLLVLIALLVVLAIPAGSVLRNPETGSLSQNSPLINGLIPIIALLFFIPSVVYGRVAGIYKSHRAVCSQLEENMSSMGSYIALIFICAQFVSCFNYSKLGTILAFKGADFLRTLGASGPVLMLLFILFTALVNLLMGSATAKWTILAPVFVPIFMLLGYSPELTQAAYRIGDSCTNLISPLMPYFAMVVVCAQKYDKSLGIGTLVSTMLPYSLLFLLGWSVLLVIWMVTGLPLGPGAELYIAG